MEITGGSCRLGLWYVHVWYNGDTIHRIRFAQTGLAGNVPLRIQQYCAGKMVDLTTMPTVACDGNSVFSRIYDATRIIRYGETATYGEIAEVVGTSPRAVGRAMSHNPTPLIIPCHRVVGANSIGGFSPALEIKEYLLALEKKNKKSVSKTH